MLQTNQNATKSNLNELSTLELAQALMERLSISPNDWHKLKSNRKVRANEQAAAAIVFLLKDQPEEALQRLHRSISAPPCPTHGKKRAGGAGEAEEAGEARIIPTSDF